MTDISTLSFMIGIDAPVSPFSVDKRVMVIMRALPGAGKTTLVKGLLADAAGRNIPVCVASADEYFMDQNGVYSFDAKKLGAAHDSCYNTAKTAVLSGCPIVVIDNTNTTRKEYNKYVDLADSNFYRVFMVFVDTDFEECLKNNSHNVPYEGMCRMRDRFESRLPTDPVQYHIVRKTK